MSNLSQGYGSKSIHHFCKLYPLASLRGSNGFEKTGFSTQGKI